MTAIRLGTRGSALALWQSRWVAGRLQALAPDVHVELVEITSTGDHITDVPLSEVDGTGFFTSTLERALAASKAAHERAEKAETKSIGDEQAVPVSAVQ